MNSDYNQNDQGTQPPQNYQTPQAYKPPPPYQQGYGMNHAPPPQQHYQHPPQQQYQPMPPPPYQPYQQGYPQGVAYVPVYVKPRTPGRGFGISSLVLGIIGIVYSFIVLMVAISIGWWW